MQAADLILKNGSVHTMDATMTVAQAVAVRGGRIVYVGDDSGRRPSPAPGPALSTWLAEWSCRAS